MKKIIAAIAMLLAVVPFIGSALNETTNYYNYTKGQVANFYMNSKVEAAHNSQALEGIVLDNRNPDDKFMKIWGMFYFGSNQAPVVNGKFVGTDAYAGIIAALEQREYENSSNGVNDYFYDFKDSVKGLDIITLDELIDVFGATKREGEDIYDIPNNKYIDRNGKEIALFDEFQKMVAIDNYVQYGDIKNGIWTKTLVEGSRYTVGGVSKYLWMIKPVLDSTGKKITAMTIVPNQIEPDTEHADTRYIFMPTVYVNKTADCHEAPTVEEHCYKCKKTAEGQFEWVILKDNDSKVGDVCELEADSTKCNPKTGSKSHLLEFSIVAALCAISLLVVRRKDLFRTM